MERKRKIIAALADLRQDIAGPVPVNIISQWQRSKRDNETHREILLPYEKTGYLVSSDSSGLSRLSAERDLIEVLNIVSRPKEIIYSYGVKVGGRGVGTWCADNTQMFYDISVPAEVLVEQMAAAQKRIHQQLLQVGVAIHKGTFWEINGGMFGKEVSILEEAAENYTDPKELIISETVRQDLPKNFHSSLTLREDLKFPRKFYSVNYDGMGINASYHVNYCYPIPFSMDFYKAMKHYGISEDAKIIIEKQFHQKIVILIKIYHPKSRLLLNELTEWVVTNAILNEIIKSYDVQQIKSNGDLGIYVSDDVNEALHFAEEVLIAFRRNKEMLSIGVASGEVMLFNLDSGSLDIAGGPVNIASKISEDIPEQNTLYVHDSIQIPEGMKSKFEAFKLLKSGVEILGNKYSE